MVLVVLVDQVVLIVLKIPVDLVYVVVQVVWGNIGSPESLCSPGSPGGLGSLLGASSTARFRSLPASQPATVWLLALLQSGPAGSRSPDKATTVGVVI